MKDNIRISLIIPCYNGEELLERCLNSIYNQDIPESEYEVICINDYSSDSTEAIMKEYQKKYQNFLLINHEKNKNLGASRNTGFNRANGKYVWFIDHDDFIAANCLKSILDELEYNQLDILEVNSNLTDPARNPKFLEANFKVDSNVISGTEYLKYLIDSSHWGSKVEVWRRIYRRDFLKTNKLDFSESLFGVEDLLFFYQCFVLCDRFKHLSEYCYTYNNDRLESMTNSKKNRGLKLAVRIIATVKVIEFFRNDRIINDQAFNQKAICTYEWSLRQFLKKIFLLDRNNLREYITKISTYKAYLRSQTKWFVANLIANPLFVKGINTIFAPFKEFRNYLK